MKDSIERKRLTILSLLKEAKDPIPSHEITKMLIGRGYSANERTVRFHLLAMDRLGFTEYIGKKGRRITDLGIKELSRSTVYEKVGFLSSRIDEMAYRMSFNLESRTGEVVVNLSYIEAEDFKKALPLICKVYEKQFSMGSLIAIFKQGEAIGNNLVPEGYIGIATVCSITLNGILLKYGIPANSRFGGLLDIKDGKASRFAEIINYNGTSIDPLEIFIKSEMTDLVGAVSTGNGLVGASFREFPASSRDKILEIAEKMSENNLGVKMEIGFPGSPLLDIPVPTGSIGCIVIGGLNPIAILEESGIKAYSETLSCYLDYKKFIHFKDLSY